LSKADNKDLVLKWRKTMDTKSTRKRQVKSAKAAKKATKAHRVAKAARKTAALTDSEESGKEIELMKDTGSNQFGWRAHKAKK
jgi:hypothetical protein